MSRDSRRLLGLIVLVAVGVTAVIVFWPGDEKQQEDQREQVVVDNNRSGSPEFVGPDTPDEESTTAPDVSTKPVTTAPAPISRTEALAAFEAGMRLYRLTDPTDEQVLGARAELAKAYVSGHLDANRADDARNALVQLADLTVFSVGRIYKDDPYVFYYTAQPGDLLDGEKGVIRRKRLRIPSQLVVLINRIKRPEDIQAGQRLKMVKGPFRAVVDKSDFTIDLFLHDVFVRRLRVGIGAPETPTPEGHFHVTLGGKLTHAPYTPPVSSGKPQISILPGEEDYPLDALGHWISLTGIKEKGTEITKEEGYGIHGTNDHSSIGKATSLGCIRLSDRDIRLVFAMLYEKWSTVDIRE